MEKETGKRAKGGVRVSVSLRFNTGLRERERDKGGREWDRGEGRGRERERRAYDLTIAHGYICPILLSLPVYSDRVASEVEERKR